MDIPNHTLKIKDLGPITECRLSIKKFTVLTGPQSNGKSTIAKAIYFFRTIKQDILNLMMQGGPQMATAHNSADWERTLKQRMRNKFLQLFGTSWVMSPRMEMIYAYTKSHWLRVYLSPDWNHDNKNFVDFEFSRDFQDYLADLDQRSFANISPAQKAREEAALSKSLDDPYETVFIPAGRNLITLLSTQLNYIFTSLEGTQLQNIDYVTRRYTELILKLKPLFESGMVGCMQALENDTERMSRYEKHRRTIDLLLRDAEKVLHGTYRCVDGEERLYLDLDRYIKINYISSGQQEIIWVFNLLFYYLLEDRRVFLILEEPESHLYPDSQQIVGELLSLFGSDGNMVLTTTHSPYILGTLNYLLLAGQIAPTERKRLNQILPEPYRLLPSDASAYHVHNGCIQDALDYTDNLTLIDNSLIDGASETINRLSDIVLECLDTEEKDTCDEKY
ncbi:MAG: ATP-binding protein [Provencibacterium sp.]|jgi:hypothetical protein|nr:ATP-binding protein [Provencibacterium sp.]